MAEHLSLTQLAEVATLIQNASNISGVTSEWHRVQCDLRHMGYDERGVRHHPINVAFLSKVMDMMGSSTGVEPAIKAIGILTNKPTPEFHPDEYVLLAGDDERGVEDEYVLIRTAQEVTLKDVNWPPKEDQCPDLRWCVMYVTEMTYKHPHIQEVNERDMGKVPQYLKDVSNWPKVAEGLWWYCADWHGGQASELYEILCEVSKHWRPSDPDQSRPGDEATGIYCDLDENKVSPQRLAHWLAAHAEIYERSEF